MTQKFFSVVGFVCQQIRIPQNHCELFRLKEGAGAVAVIARYSHVQGFHPLLRSRGCTNEKLAYV